MMGKVAIGTMPCQCCEKDVVVKANERGTLSYSCQWCDDAPYQKPGTLAFAAWQKKITPLEQEKPPVPAPEKIPAPAAPVPKKRASTFFD